MKITLPEQIKIAEALPLATDAAGRAAVLAASMKNYGKLWILANIYQGNAATILLTPMQATSVAKAGGKVLTNPVRIWANLDTAASDTFVRQADAVNFTTDAGIKGKQVLFEIDPSYLDVQNNFDCAYLSTGASNVANLTSALYLASDPRYAQATLPSVITD